MELRGTVQGVKVYDDFAHHPTAIATTIAGLRRQVGRPPGRAGAPPNTMKLGTMAARLPDALAGADLVFCFGAKSGKHALGWDPAEVLARWARAPAIATTSTRWWTRWSRLPDPATMCWS